MRVVFLQLRGGVGKSSICMASWQALNTEDEQWGYITNDVYVSLENKIPQKQLLKVGFNEKIPIVDFDCLYDCGGYASEAVKKVVENADLVFLPTLTDLISLQTHLHTIREVEELNKNIIQIVNKTKNGEFEEVKNFFQSKGINYPIYEIRESKVIADIFNQSKSIQKQIEEKVILNQYTKQAINQVNQIVNLIKERKQKLCQK